MSYFGDAFKRELIGTIEAMASAKDQREGCRQRWFIGVDFLAIRVFPKIGVPQNGWFGMENPIIDDLGGKPTIFGNTHKNLRSSIKQPSFLEYDMV